MPDATSKPAAIAQGLTAPQTAHLQELSTLELAQALAARLTLTDMDWHRLKSNRKVRASEQAAAALVFLLKDQPEEALARFRQAAGWLDRSVSAPPCPTHGHRPASYPPSSDSEV
ncbi:MULTISPECIES: DUF6439 family protein [Trichocoleus]|uniref:DUF6439 family protein n=1 Tax=Trichocoleus desertorum GB2-A4 TaxID=2933944 RepID=A0ABV0J1B7_9CYAN|nr:DUF6439 family protein [Trichocoleus sp. FACHB-46]MBD1860194.1 hypothetical protein [Trichocoleus sp. FACHB-46]